MRLWYVRPKGDGNAYGPLEAADEQGARAQARRLFGPTWVYDVWETTRKELDEMVENNLRIGCVD